MVAATGFGASFNPSAALIFFLGIKKLLKLKLAYQQAVPSTSLPPTSSIYIEKEGRERGLGSGRSYF
jgi:hypothetical protein